MKMAPKESLRTRLCPTAPFIIFAFPSFVSHSFNGSFSSSRAYVSVWLGKRARSHQKCTNFGRMGPSWALPKPRKSLSNCIVMNSNHQPKRKLESHQSNLTGIFISATSFSPTKLSNKFRVVWFSQVAMILSPGESRSSCRNTWWKWARFWCSAWRAKNVWEAWENGWSSTWHTDRECDHTWAWSREAIRCSDVSYCEELGGDLGRFCRCSSDVCVSLLEWTDLSCRANCHEQYPTDFFPKKPVVRYPNLLCPRDPRHPEKRSQISTSIGLIPKMKKMGWSFFTCRKLSSFSLLQNRGCRRTARMVGRALCSCKIICSMSDRSTISDSLSLLKSNSLARMLAWRRKLSPKGCEPLEST